MKDNGHYVLLLRMIKLNACGDVMPFCQAPATAGGRRMLGDKYRMAAHRRLFAVVFWLGGRKPLGDKILGVTGNGFRPFINTVLALFRAKAETLTKRGTSKALENWGEIIHNISSG